MLNYLQTVLMNISLILICLSGIACTLKIRKIGKGFQFLLVYFILYIIVDVWSGILSSQKINNLPLLHIYTILEFIIWSLFYKALLKDKPFFGKGFPIFITIITSLLIANSIYLEPIFGFNSNAKALVQIILIGYSMHYFFSSYGKIDFSKPGKQADLLINFAVILYYSGSLFIFMFMKTLMNRNMMDSTRGFWFFNAFLLLIFQIIIFIAVLKKAFSNRPAK